MLKKILITLIPLFILLTPVRAYADKKDMSISLSDEYTQATFYLDFETEQEYKITITSPSGLTHETTISGLSGSVSVSDIENGNYKITVEAEEKIDVKSRVECKKTQVTSDTEQINISTVVSGLKIYFKDTDLVMEWDKNANEENIDVEVMEPTTMQVLDSTKISGNYYTLDFDENIKQLVIYLVPAKSSKVDGAGSRFTIDTVMDNGGRVTFPEKTLYNTNTYTFSVTVIDNMRVYVEEDGKIVGDEKYQAAGTYDIDIPLNEMRNHITVWFEDENGNLNSFKTAIDRDIDAPLFKINPFDTVTKNKTVTIEGTVTETDTVYFNDFEVKTDEYGRFEFTQMLVIGENNLSLTATDPAGNVAQIDYIITRKEVNYLPLYICLGAGFLFIVVGVILKKKKELGPPKKNKPRENRFEDEIEERPRKPIKTKTAKQKPQRRNNTAKDVVVTLLPVVVFALLLFVTVSMLVKNTVIASGSMAPTINTNDIVIFNKLSYINNDILRGDIICFYSDESKAVLTKRVIGIAGDEISFKDGYVIINGLKAEEKYIDNNIETNCTKTFTVPEGCVFVLGDNRENSYDSRYWNEPYIKINKIYGKYLGQIRR